MSDSGDILLGPLTLSLCRQRAGNRFPANELVSLSAVLSSPHSSVAIHAVSIHLGDLLTFRRRLKHFLAREDEGAISLRVAMPHFDASFIANLRDTVSVEIRISPDLRGERHIYDFDSSYEEVTAFAQALDLALLTLSLGPSV